MRSFLLIVVILFIKVEAKISYVQMSINNLNEATYNVVSNLPENSVWWQKILPPGIPLFLLKIIDRKKDFPIIIEGGQKNLSPISLYFLKSKGIKKFFPFKKSLKGKGRTKVRPFL